MAALPYMQLYVADYLADTAHLSTLEHGAYLLLIMTYWQRGKALPAEPHKLARIARLTDAEWSEVVSNLSDFFEDRDGCWFHKRIERDLAAVEAKSQNARNARAKRSSNERPTNVEPSSNHKDTDTETTPNGDSKRAGARRKKPKTSLPDDWEPKLGIAEQMGLLDSFVVQQAQKFRSHAKAHDRQLVEWNAAFTQWLVQAVEYAEKDGRDVKRMTVTPAANPSVFICTENPLWDALDNRYASEKGKQPPKTEGKDSDVLPEKYRRGWHFPKDWIEDLRQKDAAE